MNAEDAAKATAADPKLRASREFSAAYYDWLTAKARIEDPNVEDEDLATREMEAEAVACADC